MAPPVLLNSDRRVVEFRNNGRLNGRTMHPRPFLGGGWARGGVAGSGVVRRAHPASGAQWNVQVVRGKVNGKCLWNACKALSLGLLLMVLGAAMATIGYYADHLSIAQEVRGNHTVRVKNESRGFHLNNLSYAGPIVMGVGGFIVVAACVMTFEARDSAAKVVPARFKLSASGPPPQTTCGHPNFAGLGNHHGSLRTSGPQTGTTPHTHCPRASAQSDRRAITQSFMQFSRGLALDPTSRTCSLKVSQGSISKSPSAPNLHLERTNSQEKTSPTCTLQNSIDKQHYPGGKLVASTALPGRKTFAACALLNPGLLHRHALSVDETAVTYRLSHESLQGSGSQGSMAMDLHLECPVTLRVRDRRRNPLRRQRRVDEDERGGQEDNSRRSSHSCSPRLQAHYARELRTSHAITGGSAHQLPTYSSHYASSSSHRRSSNASDCTGHRSRNRRRECHHTRGRLERAISSDSRLTGAIPRCHHRHTPTQNSTEQEPAASTSSDTDIRHSRATFHHLSVHKQ